MDRDTVIALALEARLPLSWSGYHLERFAALVEAHTMRTQLLDEVGKAIARERKACAALARQWDVEHTSTNYGGCIAQLIENRSKA